MQREINTINYFKGEVCLSYTCIKTKNDVVTQTNNIFNQINFMCQFCLPLLYFIQCRECSQKKFVSKKCTSPETHYHDIWRDKMSLGSGGPEFVAEGGIHKEAEYMYYVDKYGNIARVKIEK